MGLIVAVTEDTPARSRSQAAARQPFWWSGAEALSSLAAGRVRCFEEDFACDSGPQAAKTHLGEAVAVDRSGCASSGPQLIPGAGLDPASP